MFCRLLSPSNQKKTSQGVAQGPGDSNVHVFEQFRHNHQSLLGPGRSASDMNKEYYEEYCKIFTANSILLDKVKEVVEQKEELITKIKKLQVNGSQIELCHADPGQPIEQEHAQAKAGTAKSQRNSKEVHMSLSQLQEVVWL